MKTNIHNVIYALAAVAMLLGCSKQQPEASQQQESTPQQLADPRVAPSNQLVMQAFESKFMKLADGSYATVVKRMGFGDDEAFFIQVKPPTPEITIGKLDEADKLNNVTWTAYPKLKFSAYREARLDPESAPKWSEWKSTYREDGILAHVVEANGKLQIKSTSMTLSEKLHRFDEGMKPDALPESLR